MKKLAVTLFIIFAFATITGIALSLKADNCLLRGENKWLRQSSQEQLITIDELRQQNKLNDELAKGNYPVLPLPGAEK